MKNRIFFLLLIVLLVVCLPGYTKGTEEVEPQDAGSLSAQDQKWPSDTNVKTGVKETPQYGGVFSMVWATNPFRFDEVLGHVYSGWPMTFVYDELTRGDWAKGPAGTGETDWLHYLFPAPNLLGLSLAESWELKDPNTIVYHIRQGVHFHDKPPVNGREMNADDVVFSIKRLWDSPTSSNAGSFPWNDFFESVKALDKWTVEVKTKPGKAGMVFENVSDMCKIVPKEAVEKYGNLNEWQNACGTGPFTIEDYVQSSMITLKKNPDYWSKDPVHPENQLPYLDGINIYIMPDQATRLAALRAGKLDWIGGARLPIEWEDANSLKKSNPELMYYGYYCAKAPAMYMRLDKKPFDDLRVRQAVAMAINQEEIKESYYGGYAEMLTWPVANIKEFTGLHIPLNELPTAIQEQFEYHPDKAKQLLAEAGYPNGFDTDIVCDKVNEPLLTIVQAYLSKVGVDMQLKVLERSAWQSTGYERAYDQMYFYVAEGLEPWTFLRERETMFNFSQVHDQKVLDTFAACTANYFDQEERYRIYREYLPYILDKTIKVQLPGPYLWTFWQPWVKGYHGELEVGLSNPFDFPMYIWIDQNLKK